MKGSKITVLSLLISILSLAILIACQQTSKVPTNDNEAPATETIFAVEATETQPTQTKEKEKLNKDKILSATANDQATANSQKESKTAKAPAASKDKCTDTTSTAAQPTSVITAATTQSTSTCVTEFTRGEHPQTVEEPVTTPEPEPVPTTVCQPTQASAAEQIVALSQEMFNATNAVRHKNGLASLNYASASLQEIAMQRAQELALLFDHERPDGTYVFALMEARGITFTAASENIANFSANDSVNSVITAWENSPGHLANIIGTNYSSVAIGYHSQNGRQYWVQVFVS